MGHTGSARRLWASKGVAWLSRASPAAAYIEGGKGLCVLAIGRDDRDADCTLPGETCECNSSPRGGGGEGGSGGNC